VGSIHDRRAAAARILAELDERAEARRAPPRMIALRPGGRQ